MSEVDSPDDITNGDDSAFDNDEDDDQQTDGQIVTTIQVSDCGSKNDSITNHGSQFGHSVFVSNSHNLLTTGNNVSDDDRLKTHVVFHSGKLDEIAKLDFQTGESGLRTPTTPLPPPTPATPLSRERGLRYQWDATAFNEIIPVRCKNSNGELHKSKFGSGGRGRCIHMGGNWYTPSEFEALCGRASSKDWKRSIRFGGRTLQCLIEDNILQPHAASCTCAACCDDDTVTGPVRLFVPYKRRKKDSISGMGTPEVKKKVISQSPPKVVASIPDNINGATKEAQQTVSVPLDNALSAIPVQLTRTSEGSVYQIIAASENTGTYAVGSGDSFVINNLPAVTPQPVKQTPQPFPQTNGMDSPEEKVWWQLEEMATNLVNQAHQLRTLVEQSKQACLKAKQSQLAALKEQMEKERNEAINVLRIEHQFKHQQALMEERTQKDIVMQQALAQARAAQALPDTTNTLANKTNSQNTDLTLVTDGKNTYHVTWVNPTDNSQSALSTVNLIEDDKDPVKQ